MIAGQGDLRVSHRGETFGSIWAMTSGVHPASLSVEALQAECEVTRTRRSGPGGQNRNKVETAIVLKHRPTGLIAEANERRSQGENLQVALHRLRLTLAREVRHPVPPDGPVSAVWKKYLRGDRISINNVNPDFPTVIAEALDQVEAAELDVRAAAERLGCSTSQLTKLLKIEPKVFVHVNARRSEAGLRPLL